VTGNPEVETDTGRQNWDMLGLMQQTKDEPVAPTYIAAKAGKAGGV
jgi:hypothetical protein